MEVEPENLKAKILEDVTAAMRRKDKDLLVTLRMLTAAIKQREVDERRELSEADVLQVVEKMIKQRKDAEQQYLSGNRPELAAKEKDEMVILSTYLPEQLSEDKIRQLVEAAIQKTSAASSQDMGKVMALLKPELQGRADMSLVSKIVKENL